jgi:hypothetical protein
LSIGLHYVILPFSSMRTPMQNHTPNHLYYILAFLKIYFFKPILSKTFYHKVLLHLQITKYIYIYIYIYIFTICQGEWAQLVIETIKSKCIYCMCSWHQRRFVSWMIFRIVCKNIYQHHHEWNSFITIHFSFTMCEVFSIPIHFSSIICT